MIGCLRSILAQLSEWLFGMKDECPDLSESARIGVTIMFSTLFMIVSLFAVVLKRRMAIIEVSMCVSYCSGQMFHFCVS